MSIPGKIYGRVLISRVVENMKEQVAEEQRGFRSGRESIDQILILKQLVYGYREKRKELYVVHMVKFVEKHCGGCCMNVELIDA